MTAAAERDTLRALLAALADRRSAAALVDGDALLIVARRHRLTPLLSTRCRGALPPAFDAVCRQHHVRTVARNLALAVVAEECVAALAKAGVDTALLKGLAYERTLYVHSGARPTSDIDLLVRDRDRRAAFAVLDGLGFEPRAAAPGFDDADYHEVAWRRHGVEVDLHMALAPYARCAIDYGAVWSMMRPLQLGAAHAFVLAAEHAAVFHALHMAIDHFDVPGLYLVDLAHLLPTGADVAAAGAIARQWRCRRPFETSVALAAAFQPSWDGGRSLAAEGPTSVSVRRRFGELAPLPRWEQLLRKFAHFDTALDALRYTYVQGRRNVRESLLRRRSARARLKL
ncbi:MAG TPA: nucleotidyltransferase family protein [Polyangia bacterium]|nr:nucleotidyltransferase family protein [Polyangia bacterium]